MLGGADTERLVLYNTHNAAKTDIPGVDMDDLIARHKARYHLVAFFCRPGMRVLDFPCGTGYGSEILTQQGVRYEGRDNDTKTIDYGETQYGHRCAKFRHGNLKHPAKPRDVEAFDIIACIEGIEHIQMANQEDMVCGFHAMLKPGGKLIISSPINPTGISGPSAHNPHHLGELTYTDFLDLLAHHFDCLETQTLTTTETLSTGEKSGCVFAICQKD